jgi:hypothetical protein
LSTTFFFFSLLFITGANPSFSLFKLHRPIPKNGRRKIATKRNKFSGKRFNFMMWSARFRSYAHSEGFDDILYDYPDMVIPSKNTTLDPKDQAHLVISGKWMV